MSLVCDQNKCAGCMACIDICPKSCITIKDGLEHMNAVIDDDVCIHCNACHQVCQQQHPSTFHATVESCQGWAQEEIRDIASSGGFATAIILAFIKNGGVVAACHFENGEFTFSIIHAKDDISRYTGSKYVKSDPSGIYKSIASELRNGKKVLFIGLPCQVSSLINYITLRAKAYRDSLFTIDLICHGTPSVKILQKALQEYGYSLEKVNEIYFRRNTMFGLRTDIKNITRPGVVDRYLTAFLKGGIYTANCYSCHYARKERVSDITLGDSWGTELKNEENKGISLALIQTEKGKELLAMTNVKCLPVDYDNAVRYNHQLQYPSIMTKEHDIIFNRVLKGKSFRSSVLFAYPSYCIKQDVKNVLTSIKLIRGGIISTK